MKVCNWKYAIFALCIFSSGCGSEAEKKFDALCREQAGIWIYKTVQAEGFFNKKINCSERINFLMSTNFKFIEYCNDSNLGSNPMREAGCWRLSKSSVEDPKCNQELTNYGIRGWRVINPNLPSNFCLSSEQIVAASAEYEYYMSEEKIYASKDRDPQIYRNDWIIKRINSSAVLAKQTDFHLFRWNPVSGGYSSKSCENSTSNNSEIKLDILTKVIISK